jgi:acetyltransferase-like isoleucine patch superfamily enzyme
MIGLIVYLEQAFRNCKFRVKGWCLKVYLLLHGCKVGKGLKCVNFPSFGLIPFRNIYLGDQVTIGENIVIEVTGSGILTINNGVNLTRNVMVVVNSNIEIGSNCLIAENVTIRDANHQVRKSKIIHQQISDTAPIKIGSDVWIGANSVILKGSTIADGCVIGANSLVLEKSVLESNGIYGGCPVKLLKHRQ